jgi:DNA polymerase alpha subunit A
MQEEDSQEEGEEEKKEEKEEEQQKLRFHRKTNLLQKRPSTPNDIEGALESKEQGKEDEEDDRPDLNLPFDAQFQQSSSSSSSSLPHMGSSIDPSSFMKQEEETGEEYLPFYYFDATEANGTIYLFGRVVVENSQPHQTQTTTQTVSCCVQVHGQERNLFVLPRKTGEYKADGTAVRASIGDVYAEMREVLVPSVIPRSSGQAFKAKPVQRKYAFDDGEVPREETEYLKIVYDGRLPLPSEEIAESEGRTYQRMFGGNTPLLEWFILKRKLMGPCWLKIKGVRPVNTPVSWCKLELAVTNPKLVQKPSQQEDQPAPALKSMTLSMKTVVNPQTHTHEIVMLSALTHGSIDLDKQSPFHYDRHMTFIRPLGLSAGAGYPSRFPHDL